MRKGTDRVASRRGRRMLGAVRSHCGTRAPMIDVTVLRQRAESLRALHDRSRVLVLPNAWDVVSARLVESAGFPAVATSSAAVAWSLGYPDGERIPRDEMIAVVAQIARAV